MSQLERWYWVAAAVPVAASVLYVILLAARFGRLPVEVPVHFGLDGTANGWLNRWVWLVLSPLMLAGLILLVFTTGPAPDGGVYTLATGMYWGACGLAIGAFVGIVRAASRQRSFSVWPLVAWLVALPVLAGLTTLALRPWWQGVIH